jgi:tryptophan synthase alpha chain
MSRIQATFKSLKNKNEKALIPFFTAGDPHPDRTVEIMHTLVESGADMIELGIPFSDPMADGPVIQRASERALKNNVGITRTIKLAAEFRKNNKTTPLILMGYANPIEAIGVDNFVRLIKDADIDGVITVDYPPEESEEFVKKLKENNIDSIFLISPTTDDKRIELIINQATGFLYYVSLKGVTGSANIDIKQVSKKVNNIKEFTELPVGVGFGVRDAKTAKEVAEISDAVVIGSRIVQEIEDSNDENLINNIRSLVTDIKNSISDKGISK